MTRRLAARTVVAALAATAAARQRLQGERGDVPGWVLVTLMTALIVAALWGFAQEQLRALFQRAMGTV